MFFRVRILIGLLGLVLPFNVLAEEVVIPLSITSPDFPASTETVEFSIGLPIDAVTQISLHLEGTYQEVLYVDISNPYVPQSHPAYLEMHLAGNENDDWAVSERHQFPAGAGSFDIETILMSQGSGDWEFLSDGAGLLGLECGPGYIQAPNGQIFGAASSWGSVTAASLVVSFEPSVPVAVWTWGSVKSVYR